MIPGSYANGFAPRDFEPAYPQLWNGCIEAFCPSLGVTGVALRDWGGRKRDGTLNNGVAWGAGNPLLNFTAASSHYVSTTFTPVLTDFSISAWIKEPGDSVVYFPISCRTSDGANGIFILYENTAPSSKYGPEIGFTAAGALSRKKWSASRLLTAGVMYHVCGTHVAGSTGLTLYVTGVAGGTATETAATNPGAGSTFTLGRDGANSSPNYYGGSLDDVRLYDRALNANEVKLLARRPGIAYEPVYRRRFVSVGIRFDAASNSGLQVAQSTYTFDRTVSGNNTFLAVDVALLSAGQTVSSIVDDSTGGAVPLTLIGAQTTVTSFGRIESWGLVAPAAGTKTIAVTLTGSVSSAGLAVSYTGVHQTVPTEAYNSAQATNVGATDAVVAITPIADNTWLHAAVATDDGSITAGQTTRNNVSGGATLSGANEDSGPITPAAATDMSYTGVGALATWAIGGYAIRPVAAAGAITLIGARNRRVPAFGRMGR